MLLWSTTSQYFLSGSSICSQPGPMWLIGQPLRSNLAIFSQTAFFLVLGDFKFILLFLPQLATKIIEHFRRGRVHIKQCRGKWIFPPLAVCNNVISITMVIEGAKPEKQESGATFSDILECLCACGWRILCSCLAFWMISYPSSVPCSMRYCAIPWVSGL